jgi:hypothetical protein
MDGDGESVSDCSGCKRLSAEVEQLRREVELLRQALDESRRAGKRQVAPFRKKKVSAPQKPGRKPGDEYGQQSRRSIPERIDEHYDVPLPESCPHCGGHELTTFLESRFTASSTSTSGTAPAAANAFRVGMSCRRPMLWERRPVSWEPICRPL